MMNKISKLISWKNIEALLLEYYEVGTSKEGADAYPPLMLLKCLLLQKWFHIPSDPELENQINDRISFKKFLGISIDKPSPDHSTFSRFRSRLSKEALMKAGEDWEKGKEKKLSLAQLIAKVASYLDLKKETIISSSRKKRISEARGIICYLAVNDMGYSTSEVAHALDVRRVSAGQCVTRGKKILNKSRNLRDKLIN